MPEPHLEHRPILAGVKSPPVLSAVDRSRALQSSIATAMRKSSLPMPTYFHRATTTMENS